MAVIYTPHFIQFLDENGNPLSGGKLYTYEAGTTTPKATYTTSAASVENANPIILDSAGRATIFIDGAYRFDLFDANDVLIESTDNITNFTTTGAEEDSFFESFSGDGETVSFTLSEAQGTDEKVLNVSTAFEYSVNGDFDTDSDWTKGTGWTIGSGVATATGAISTDLEQDAGRSLIEGQLYTVTMTITRSAGSITPNIGGTTGTARSSAGTYTENIIAGNTQKITFSTSGFTGTVDDVSVTKVGEFGVVSTADYTINGTALTFIDPPASGTGNILVFNYARLAGAASSSASSAATSAANAATSATNASNVETRLTGIASTSSVVIGTGTKSFTVASGLGFTAGQWVLIDSDADGSNYMFGQITSYSSTTLEVNVTAVGGSGTYADWTITVSGVQGVQGATGAVSATSGVTAATSAGASLISSGGNDCLDWGSGGTANLTLRGNMSGASTHKLVNMPDPTAAQDYATKAYVDAEISGIGGNTALINIQYFTSSGTYTPHANAIQCDVEVYGASGGGGGGGSGAGSGGAGGSTSFSGFSNTVTANGGSGGGAGTGTGSGNPGSNGSHGTASGGDNNQTGGGRSGGNNGAAPQAVGFGDGGAGGAGGLSIKKGIDVTGGGTATITIGAAGSAGSAGASSTAGQAGIGGLIIIYEYGEV